MDKIKNYFSILEEDFRRSFGGGLDNIFTFQKDIHDWKNIFFTSEPNFRHIHLEYYNTDKITVLHSNIFPSSTNDFPILGFDLIALNGKITGLFFDFTDIETPIKDLTDKLILFKESIKSKERKLPEWAKFFSPNFICVSPDEEEIDYLFDACRLLILNYLQEVKKINAKIQKNIEIQNQYCVGQKKNDKTFKALASEIGEDNAKDFLNNYLFPEIKV